MTIFRISIESVSMNSSHRNVGPTASGLSICYKICPSQFQHRLESISTDNNANPNDDEICTKPK